MSEQKIAILRVDDYIIYSCIVPKSWNEDHPSIQSHFKKIPSYSYRNFNVVFFPYAQL